MAVVTKHRIGAIAAVQPGATGKEIPAEPQRRTSSPANHVGAARSSDEIIQASAVDRVVADAGPALLGPAVELVVGAGPASTAHRLRRKKSDATGPNPFDLGSSAGTGTSSWMPAEYR